MQWYVWFFHLKKSPIRGCTGQKQQLTQSALQNIFWRLMIDQCSITAESSRTPPSNHCFCRKKKIITEEILLRATSSLKINKKKKYPSDCEHESDISQLNPWAGFVHKQRGAVHFVCVLGCLCAFCGCGSDRFGDTVPIPCLIKAAFQGWCFGTSGPLNN